MSESSGEKRIKISKTEDIEILSQASIPQAKKIKTGEAGNFEGFLIQVTGRIVQLSGSTFYIDDGSGKIRIYISKNTGIKKPKMKKGDWVTIIGIVSQAKSGFRILPRFLKDIIMGKKATEKSSGFESKISEILGAEEALAAGQDLGQDYRPQTKGIISWIGWGLIIFGLVFLILFFGFSYWRKRNVE
ncbi:hypothetical protein ES702_06682 [subsurface metagenome]